jgi:hypothetical protein
LFIAPPYTYTYASAQTEENPTPGSGARFHELAANFSNQAVFAKRLTPVRRGISHTGCEISFIRTHSGRRYSIFAITFEIWPLFVTKKRLHG